MKVGLNWKTRRSKRECMGRGNIEWVVLQEAKQNGWNESWVELEDEKKQKRMHGERKHRVGCIGRQEAKQNGWNESGLIGG